MQRLLLAVVALAAAAFAAATAGQEIPGTYLVELSPQANVTAFAGRVKTEVNARIRRQINYMPPKANGVPFKAVSIELKNASKINEVASTADVLKVHPVKMLALDDVSSPDERAESNKKRSVGKTSESLKIRRALPETNATADTHPYIPHSMMQVDKLHSKGITGKGIKIAMIGTGVDYEHPALGGCFGPGCLFSFGADLVNGEPTPKDCLGHGTKVAGIIAAQRNDLGVVSAAPGAQMGVFRITCDGFFASDVMVDAIFRALAEGVDIITSSVVLPGGWPDSLLSSTASRVVDSGVVFVQAAGKGGLGLFSLSDPAAGNGVISVTSMQSRVVLMRAGVATYAADNGSQVSFPFHPSFPSENFTGTPMEVYAPNLRDIHACAPIPDSTPDLSEKLVLLQIRTDKGHCFIRDRIESVREKGATRILVYAAPEDKNPGLMYLPNLPEEVVAVGALGFDVATSILEALQAGRKVSVTAFPFFKPHGTQSPRTYVEVPYEEKAGAISVCTSWGPTWNLGLKPSLAAIGRPVLSTAARDVDPSGYTIARGSGYATPLIAGIVALILEARGSLDPATVESLLVSHSDPQLYHNGTNFLPYLAPVAQQGGGLARAYDSAFSTTLLEPAGLNFNDTEHMPASLNLTLRNVGDVDVTYRLSHVPAITVYAFAQNGLFPLYPSTLDHVEISAAITISETSLTLTPGENATVSVSASVHDGLDAARLPIWSGWITINGTDGSSLSVPYQGVAGSIRHHQVLPPDGISLFYGNASVTTGGAAVKLPAPGSAETSDLILSINSTLGIPLVRAEVVPLTSPSNGTNNATTTAVESAGQLQWVPLRWIPENLADGDADLLQFVRFSWNGQLESGEFVPEGSYKLVVRALRIFGDPNNHDDWDVSESPRLDITYHKKNNTHEKSVD
ncbi:subtilisin-like serine protease PR1C [Metarhizium album ARSEF 1941]|uniref:Subtilisin-like serine protease PR1C n=1 Tax=Metarhizium album (strain ARSEF 1941) TaxID=1081103 RepID=A0A0B2WMX9_METAS|nr:subtilisin-like serine protease PR1C [Metarhizium album ARSEF 1941]KHN97426.1 subtilisin-like serine protease PR1C [Metarhizium album ARSEF 1941]